MLTQDWMMRQIKTMTLSISKLVFQKDSTEYQPSGAPEAGGDVLSDADNLHISLNVLLKEGKLCEAEDLLFDALEDGAKETLEVAVDFYYRLNERSNKELEDGGFSREEIADGLNDVMERYGVVLP